MYHLHNKMQTMGYRDRFQNHLNLSFKKILKGRHKSSLSTTNVDDKYDKLKYFIRIFSKKSVDYLKITKALKIRALVNINILLYYTLKCENALLASAMRCVSSFFLKAAPSPFAAAIISLANLSAMVLPLRSRL